MLTFNSSILNIVLTVFWQNSHQTYILGQNMCKSNEFEKFSKSLFWLIQTINQFLIFTNKRLQQFQLTIQNLYTSFGSSCNFVIVTPFWGHHFFKGRLIEKQYGTTYRCVRQTCQKWKPFDVRPMINFNWLNRVELDNSISCSCYSYTFIIILYRYLENR